jgi:hypothetical protein
MVPTDRAVMSEATASANILRPTFERAALVVGVVVVMIVSLGCCLRARVHGARGAADAV